MYKQIITQIARISMKVNTTNLKLLISLSLNKICSLTVLLTIKMNRLIPKFNGCLLKHKRIYNRLITLIKKKKLMIRTISTIQLEPLMIKKTKMKNLNSIQNIEIIKNQSLKVKNQPNLSINL